MRLYHALFADDIQQDGHSADDGNVCFAGFLFINLAREDGDFR
jgi:hypothetical protein